MAHYLASDGVNDYVQLSNPVAIPGSTPYRIEIDFQALDGSDFGVRLSGNSGSNTGRVIVFKGANPNTIGGLGTIGTTGGVNILNRAVWAWYRLNETTNKVAVDGAVMPAALENGGGFSFAWLLSELNATNSRNPVNLYSYKVFIADVLVHHWDPSASNGTGNQLLDIVGGNHGTLINFATDGSQWVYYDNGTEQTSHAVELSAMATLQLVGQKVGQALSAIIGAASAQINASKIAKAQAIAAGNASASLGGVKVGNAALAVTANSAASLAANKTGRGAASINATASINLTAGNVITVQATINFNATASIGLLGSKCANASVEFLSAATSQLQASKTGAANVNLAAGNTASLSSSKTGYCSFTVPVSISITLSGLSAATRPVAKAVFINNRSTKKSSLATGSTLLHTIKTQSRQRYNLQSGGANA